MKNTVLLCLMLILGFPFFANLISAQNPEITENLNVKVSACLGSSFSYSILVQADEIISYKWFKNDEEILNESNSQLTFEQLSLEDAGDYQCLVYCPGDTLVSNISRLSIDSSEPNNLTISIPNTSICLASNTFLTASYQGGYGSVLWFKNQENIAQASTLSIFDINNNDAGEYYFEVTNACGTATSSPIEIEVIDKPTITQPLNNQDICQGNNLIFTAQVQGQYLDYKWYKGDELLDGQNGESLVLSDLLFPHTSLYRYEVSNICGSVNSNPASVHVKTPPSIQAQPISASNCLGETVNLSVSASSNIGLNYQWYKMPNQMLENATTSNLQISVENPEDMYFCKFSNECAVLYSDTVLVELKLKPEFVTHPSSGNVCEGSNYNLWVKAIGDSPLTYKWYFNDANINMSNVEGSNTSTINFTEITQAQSGNFTCVATNQCGSATSEIGNIEVKIKPYFTHQPVSQTLCEGNNINLSVLFSGTEPFQIAWKKEGSNEVLSTSNEYLVEAVGPEFAGNYYCVLTNDCGEVNSNMAQIIIKPAPHIQESPSSLTVCVGEQVDMSIELTHEDDSFIFLWFRNGQALSSQTNKDLFYESAQFNHAGTYYCRVENECGYDMSLSANLVVNELPVIVAQPISREICARHELKLELGVNLTGFQAQWYRNNQPITGANSPIFIIPSISPDMAGTYYCKISNACGSVNSHEAIVQVKESPDLSLGEDIHACEGENLEIKPLSGDFMSYNWNDGLSYMPSLEVVLSGQFILEVIGGNSCTARDTIQVEFHPYHEILFSDNDVVSCGPYTLDAGLGAYSYAWSVAEETSHTFIVLNSGTYSLTTTGDSFGCESSKSINIEIMPPIDFSLGEDITTSVKSSVEIGVEPIYSSYLWSNGFTGPKLTVHGNLYGVGAFEFNLKVVDTSGCLASDNITITFVVDDAINDINAGTANIYPNPASEYIIIENLDLLISKIQLINALGQNVFSSSVNATSFRLDLKEFNKGFYIIKLIDEYNNITNYKIQIL